MTRIPLLLVGLALVFPATASARSCSSNEPGAGNLTARNVSCTKARIILNARLSGQTRPFNFTCKARPYEGGSTTTCTKGDRRVRFQIAD
ncbi:MAG: hypothetical protein WKF94_14815 [Solirubrobacteraceae bacterium]